jgi:hypothetical protein
LLSCCGRREERNSADFTAGRTNYNLGPTSPGAAAWYWCEEALTHAFTPCVPALRSHGFDRKHARSLPDCVTAESRAGAAPRHSCGSSSRFGERSSRRKRCGPTRKVKTTTSVTLNRLLTRCSGSQDVPYVSSITLPCSKRCMCDMDTPSLPGRSCRASWEDYPTAVSHHIAGKLGCRTKTIGAGAVASNGDAAFGDGAGATGSLSAAIGPNASATFANSSATGAGASAIAANQMAFGTAPMPAMSYHLADVFCCSPPLYSVFSSKKLRHLHGHGPRPCRR